MELEWKETVTDGGYAYFEAEYRGMRLVITYGYPFDGVVYNGSKRIRSISSKDLEIMKKKLVSIADSAAKRSTGVWHPYPQEKPTGVWHPYPQEKPTENERYILTCEYPHCVGVTFGKWWDDEFCDIDEEGKVIAWAEMPRPYVEADA